MTIENPSTMHTPHNVDDAQYATMRDRLQTALGDDYVYFTAQDAVRHFDSHITVIGTLIALLISALTSAIKEFSKNMGKAGWDRLASSLDMHSKKELPDIRLQLAEIKRADETIREVGEQLSMVEGKEFLSTVRSAIESELISLRFPAVRASRIATELGSILEERLTGERR